MTPNTRPILAALVTTVSLSGCPNATTPGGSVPFDDYVQATAQADCDFFARCGTTDTYGALLLRSTITDCPTQIREWFENTAFAQLDDAIASGTIVYHGDRAGACFDALDAVACSGLGSGASSACLGVFEGTVGTGGACSLSTECANGASCTGASGATCGTCGRVAGIGEACGTGTGTATCAIGNVCAHGICATPSGAGGPCDTTVSTTCQLGTSCIATAGSTDGTCMALAPATEGMTCSILAQCTPGLVCGSTAGSSTQTCRQRRTDGTCQSTYLGTADCAAGMTCSVPTGMTEGTCVSIPTLGQPCTQVCASPARCVSGSCVMTRRAGESCASGDECITGHCDASVCTSPGLCTP